MNNGDFCVKAISASLSLEFFLGPVVFCFVLPKVPLDSLRERNGLNAQVLECFGVWRDSDVQLLFDHFVQVEVLPVVSLLGHSSGDFSGEIGQLDVSLNQVLEDLVDLKTGVNVRPTCSFQTKKVTFMTCRAVYQVQKSAQLFLAF